MSTIFVQKMVSDAIRLAGVPCQRLGPAGNVYVFGRLSDLFEVGHILFTKKAVLISAADYARREKVSRQAVDHWLHRDGKRIALIFQTGKKKSLTFIVEAE